MKKCLTKFLFSAFFVVMLVTTGMAQEKNHRNGDGW